jgi:hypothetical protein
MQDTSCFILTIFDALFDRGARLPPTLIDGKPGETHRRCSVVFNVHDKGEVFEHRAAFRSGESGLDRTVLPETIERSLIYLNAPKLRSPRTTPGVHFSGGPKK